jgi:hypothetical protein
VGGHLTHRSGSGCLPLTYHNALGTARAGAALQAIGEALGWLVRSNRSVPFRGRWPVKLMAERDGEGMSDVLQFLNRAVLRRSLG